MEYPVDLSQNVKFVIAFKSVLTIKMKEKLAKKKENININTYATMNVPVFLKRIKKKI